MKSIFRTKKEKTEDFFTIGRKSDVVDRVVRKAVDFPRINTP